jgi:exopolyphosphatase/guanosine-5'-triphosphate,3'-diphosphate pyrophosphatase
MLPRFGAIDVGSNAMRIRIAEARDGVLVEIASARAPVRLGRDVFSREDGRGAISAATLSEACHALKGFRSAMHRAGVRTYRAVATSATRDASNGESLVARAKRDAGVALEVIDGDEEARLVRIAASRRVPLVGKTVLADVGGGSTEITVLEGRRVTRSVSLALGTVRLVEACLPDGGAIGRRRMAVLEEVVDRSVAAVARHLADANRVVATGGTVRALAKICGAEGGLVRARAVEDATDRLRRLDHDERMWAFDLRADRADTIVPAAVIVARIAEAAHASWVHAPGCGLRDGILAELADEHEPAHRERSRRRSRDQAAFAI